LRIRYILFFMMLALCSDAQDTTLVVEPLPVVNRDSIIADSIHRAEQRAIHLHHAMDVAYYTSAYMRDSTAAVHLDIEQQREVRDDSWIFYLLLAMLVVVTYLRVGFAGEVDNQVRSLFNSNISAQLFRASRDSFTLFTILMNAVFIIAMSMLVRMWWLHEYPSSSLHETFSVLRLIFLFTFFFVAKYMLLLFIGNVFELRAYTDEYWYNYAAICRSLGIASIPILFLSYALQDQYFTWITIILITLLCLSVIAIVIRGLSTSYKLLYRSVYHFLLYVCVSEILPIFLFIKLLTKSAN
jgi:Domain of unknown function (DUF4271)